MCRGEKRAKLDGTWWVDVGRVEEYIATLGHHHRDVGCG